MTNRIPSTIKKRIHETNHEFINFEKASVHRTSERNITGGKKIKKRESMIIIMNSLVSCGGSTRTNDLWVMSPTSYHCSTPRYFVGAKVLLLFELSHFSKIYFDFIW